ncbi:MAG TPA: hypothetical protein VNQ53_13120 [Nocardioides sp.]|nr:hypothetical protein [Nocardioides sp.]
MTERLNQLLHDEADRLEIPPVAAVDVLGRGRVLRRRRRAGSFVLAAALVVLVGTGGVVAYDRLSRDSTPQLSDAAAYEQHGVWMADGALHIGNNSVEIEGAINAVYYTAAGVVVRTGETGDDEIDPQDGHLSLVRPDGSVSPLGPRLDDVEPGTSPDSPLIAFARPVGSDFEAVVWNVETDELVAAVPFDRPRVTWHGWAAPPVSLSGDHVYVSAERHVLAVNFRTGASKPLAGSPGGRWEVIAGGNWADERSGEVVVRTLEGQELLTVPVETNWAETALSPDGRFVVVAPESDGSAGDATPSLHDVTTGASRELPGDQGPLGWTPDGHALQLSGDKVLSCTAIEQECSTVAEVDDPKSVRLADAYYGS